MKDAAEFAKQFDNSKSGGKMPKSKSKPAPIAKPKAKPRPQQIAQPKKVVVPPAPKKPTKDDGRIRAGSPSKISGKSAYAKTPILKGMMGQPKSKRMMGQ